MTHPLDGCWAKIERGKEHIDAFDQYSRQTFSVEANLPRLGIKCDPKTGEHVLYVSHAPDLGAYLTRTSLMLGDVLHNFRCVLDHLTFQLAVWHTGGKARNEDVIQFPIVDSPRDFATQARRRLAELHPDHVAIIERFQPYHPIAEGLAVGGPQFHSLGMLRDLSNTDKHRLLTPVVVPPNSFSGHALLITAIAWNQSPNLINTRQRVELGAEFVRVKVPAGVSIPDMEMAGHVHPVVTLPEGWPVVHVTTRIAALVVKVISEFQPRL